MALELKTKIDVPCNCNTITIQDITYPYDVSTNLTGYDVPGGGQVDNRDPQDATAATISITTPLGVTTVIDVLATLTAATDLYNLLYTVNVEDLTQYTNASILEAGKWTILYSVTFPIQNALPETIYTYTTVFYNWCTYKNCLKTQLSAIEEASCCSDCFDKQVTLINQITTYITALANAAECQNDTEFNSIKASLDKLCAQNEDCKCT